MENSTLTKLSQPPCADSPSTIDSLISEWVAKLAINAGAALDAKTQGVYCSLWLEGLGDLSPGVLRAAFQKTLRECAYWPVKVADIRKHVSRAESNATAEAAEQAWERVLECRRVYWSPDLPGGFSRGMPKLSDRVATAARAAGVWRDFPTTEALQVWAKKVFIESFIAWGEAEQDKFLLPDGEIKNLLAGVAETKALRAPEVCFEDLHKRGLQYAEECKVLSAWKRAADALPGFDAETRAEIEAELSAYGKRFKTAMEKRQADCVASIPEPQAVEA